MKKGRWKGKEAGAGRALSVSQTPLDTQSPFSYNLVMIKQYFINITKIIFICSVLTFCVFFDSQAQRGIELIPKSDRNHSEQPCYALVIGNSNYKTAPLKNPVNDARDIAELLQKKKFHVTLLIDATRKEMRKEISMFGNRLKGSGVGLFYFAGHGMQVNGYNYLIPIGAQIETEEDVQYESINVNIVLNNMHIAGNDLNMVFLDACRNNPFARSFRSVQMGLAPMDAPKGSLISFATAPGSVAADGSGKNGIFTKHLLEQINVPNLEVGQMMRRVRTGVQADTNNQQTPFEVSSLTGNFYFSGIEPEKKVSDFQAAATSHELSPEEEMWKMIKDSDNRSEIQLFVDTYPQGKFVKHAELKLARLGDKQLPVAQKRADGPAALPETDQAKYKQKTTGKMEEASPFSSIKSAFSEIAKFAINDKDKKIDQSSGKVTVRDRFVLADGTVHDLETGLMWATADNGADIDWHQSEIFCRTYDIGGYTDWRMPTLKELENLEGASVFGSFQITSLLDLSACCLWSSDNNGNIAANYVFLKDQTQWVLKVRKSYSRVLPVRDVK
jgi:uncharacterized caspase-like protein